MINPFAEVNWNPGVKERRKFAVSLIIGFPILAAIFLAVGWVRTGHWDTNIHLALWLAGAGAGAGILFWLAPQIARPFYVVWYCLACCIGIVVSNVLLGGFYYLVVTPVGIARRVFGRPPIRRKFDRGAASYWEDVPPVADPGRYYKQF